MSRNNYKPEAHTIALRLANAYKLKGFVSIFELVDAYMNAIPVAIISQLQAA